MAYAALVFLDNELKQLLPKQEEYIHLYQKEQIESLHSNVISLEKFLEDFPGNRSSVIKQLEAQITDVAYEVSDIIAWGISGYKEKLESCIEKVDSIAINVKKMRTVLEKEKSVLEHDSPITTSSSTVAAPSDKNAMVGLDRELSQMKERIFRRNAALEIIPITGMGGIGKTTLAKNVYEDPAIVAHFDVCAWVTVSQKHNAQKILKEILGDAKDAMSTGDRAIVAHFDGCAWVTVSQEHNGQKILREIPGDAKDATSTDDRVIAGKVGSLIVGVHKKLIGRRFLIVMDDIWSVEAWDTVRNAFPDDNKGSRIVITTREIEVVTKISSSSPLHEMQLMNEVQSWELFQNEAFGEKERCTPPLEKVGKLISSNCKGLPLAIVVTGRLLKLNHKKHYWENFARNLNEAIGGATQENQIMEILSFSYDNLPPHLKACFLYTSMFPEDAEMPSKKLKWLWVAEGFLKPAKDKSVEEVADKCLVDLVERNLLTVKERGSCGGIRTCTIHDLLRDLSLRKAIEDKFSQQIITCNTGTATNVVRTFFRKHMPLFKNETNSDSQLIVYRQCVRINTPAILRLFGVNKTKYDYVYSLICHHKGNYKDMLPTMESNLVRVLDVYETSFQSLMAFGVNLRYLAFSYSGGNGKFKDTIVNICKLRNLETLIIKCGAFSKSLFFPILEMPKLKHFVLITRKNKDGLIENYNRASSNNSLLQTLSGVRDFVLTTNVTEIFANLVKLKLNYRHDRVDDTFLDNLVRLHQLQELTLSISEGDLYFLPTHIAFPHKLKKVTLEGFFLQGQAMSVIGSLPNLQVLKVKYGFFVRERQLNTSRELTERDYHTSWEPTEGEFPQLKYLKLDRVILAEWKVESNHFPCLEQLIVDRVTLRELPAAVGEIESLNNLVVRRCLKCVGDCARRIQEEQQRYENYQLLLLVEELYENYQQFF